MAKRWDEVIQSEGFQALSPEDKALAQKQYFRDVISIKTEFQGLSNEDKELATNQFFNTPLDFSQENRRGLKLNKELFSELGKSLQENRPINLVKKGLLAVEDKLLKDEDFKPVKESVETIEDLRNTIGRSSVGILSGLADISNLAGTGVKKVSFLKDAGAFLEEKSDKLSKLLSKKGEEIFPVVQPEVFEGTFIQNPSFKRAANLVAGGIPSLAVMLTVPGGVALLSGVEGSSVAKEALAEGKSYTHALTLGGLTGLGTYMLEKIGLKFLTKGPQGKLTRKFVKQIGKKVPKGAVAIGGGMFVEGGTEGLQKSYQNLIRKIGIDKSILLSEGVLENFISGSGLGGMVGGFNASQITETQKLIDDAIAQGVTPENINTIIESLGEEVVNNKEAVKEVVEENIDKQAEEVPVEEAPVEEVPVEEVPVEEVPVEEVPIEEVPPAETIPEQLASDPDTTVEQKPQEEITPEQEEAARTEVDYEPLTDGQKRESLGPRIAETFEPKVAKQAAEMADQFEYTPIPEKITFENVRNIIEQDGLQNSILRCYDTKNDLSPRDRGALSMVAIKMLQQQAKTVTDTTVKGTLTSQQLNLTEFLSDFATTGGQGIQIFRAWSELSPEGFVKKYNNLIKKGNKKVIDSNLDLKEEINKILEDDTIKNKQKKINSLLKKRGVKKPNSKDIVNKTSLTDNEFADFFGEAFKLPTFDEAIGKEILRLAEQIEQAPEGFQKDEKTIDVLNYIAQQKDVSALDKGISIYYSNILSGLGTQVVNAGGSLTNIFGEMVVQTLKHPTSIPSMMVGFYQGLLKGGPEFWYSLTTGKITGRRLKKLKEMSSVLERDPFTGKATKLLNSWKYVLRFMIATDMQFFKSAEEMKSRVLARQLAKSEGLRGKALSRRMTEILSNDTKTINEAKAQAKKEGLTGIRAKKRVNEIIEQKRPEELVQEAVDFAGKATYNTTPVGTIGLIANVINKMNQNAPGFRAIIPFTNIVANVANESINYTPWGYKRFKWGHWGGEYGTDAPIGENAKSQLAKATVGTMAMAITAALSFNDLHEEKPLLRVTGAGPRNKDLRNLLRQTGWKPYTIQIGDKYFSYQYTPLALGLGFVGRIVDAVRFKELEEKDWATRISFGLLLAPRVFFDMSFLSGLSSVFSLLGRRGVGRPEKTFEKLLRIPSSVVIPNFNKELYRLFDPNIYETTTVRAGLLKEIPVARKLGGKGIRPIINIFGEEVKRPRTSFVIGRFMSKAKNDRVAMLLSKNNVFVRSPGTQTYIGNRTLNPDEYYEYVKISGKNIRQDLEAVYDDIKDLPASALKEVVKTIQDKRRKEARAILTIRAINRGDDLGL